MNIISLTTDFGLSDWFAGTIKGVILDINPRATVVDITHEIPGGDIRAGAFALAASYKFFPKKTVHFTVVDPGVGSQRNAIAVQTENYFFVGPDNGVLSYALAREKIKTIQQLANQKFFLPQISSTFHGRDIFAPAAAHLSKGVPIQKLGLQIADFVRINWPQPQQSTKSICGEIVYIDRFGDAITNIDDNALTALDSPCCEILVKNKKFCLLKSFYQAVPSGKPVAVIGSSRLLEIAVNGGSAAMQFSLKVGDAVTVRFESPH